MKYKILFVVLLCVKVASAQKNNLDVIIPRPSKVTAGLGFFEWNGNTKLSIQPSLSGFSAPLVELKSISIKNKAKGVKNVIILSKDPTITAKEGYKLIITSTKIEIKVAGLPGAFWAIASLKQLIGEPLLNSDRPFKPYKVPSATIIDEPAFAWRGMMLDVSRHFFDKEYVFKMLDRMSYYKFNKLHLHLTDDQGWRIEIKKYPELTEKGAWRTFNNQDSICLELAKTNPDFALPEKHIKVVDGKKIYGGYYTQDEIRSIIAYADLKGIEVIPEIDMPGHMMAATKLMPWLTSGGKTGFGKNFSQPLCPCKETTYEFAENVFSEIISLFPSKYIHLGADEVEKDSWKESKECEELMKKEGLKSIEELQSYFVRRMEKFFKSKGKQLIGWDEVLEGGATPTTTVMYWRSWVKDAPKIAAERGNKVIMSPSEYCYFDYKQDNETIKKLYSLNPKGFKLNKKEQELVLGVQANVWTESIPSENRLEYMIFPRMLGLSEVAWSKNKDSWDAFNNRLQQHIPLLDAMQISYRMPDILGIIEKSAFVDNTYLKVEKPFKGMEVRYTTDGKIPDKNSKLLPDELLVDKSTTFKIAGFNKAAHRGDIYTIDYEKQNYAASTKLDKPIKGLEFFYYPISYKNTKGITEKDLAKKAITEAIEIPVTPTAPSFATRHVGYFYAAETGVYSFALRSDDGSVLKIGNQVLIDNDGMHSSVEKSAQLALEKGYHAFELLFVEGGGGYTLKLQCKIPNGALKDVTSDMFAH